MRFSAYKKALSEAAKLPLNIPEMKRYFGLTLPAPRFYAINTILDEARHDKKLGHGELRDILNIAGEIKTI